MKTVGFRVDAASHTGTGHLQRCLTLAKELKKFKINSIFFVRQFFNDFFDIILENGFSYEVIGSTFSNEITENHFEWLGVTQHQDASDFLQAILDFPIDALIIDHYSINHVWQDTIKKYHSFPIIIIDDLANRVHNCDLLIDQNFWPSMQDRYNDLIPITCIRLLGPKYALLNPRFNTLREENYQTNYSANKILVNFGGVGNIDLWQKVIPALINIRKFNFHIITGKLPSNDFDLLSDLASCSAHIYIEETTNQMAELMSVSNYCLGACGSTVWERFCLGLNSALIEVADNQHELLQFLANKSLVDYLGNINSISRESIYSFFNKLKLDSPKYMNRKKQIASLVDGYGTERVVNKIMELDNV